jgi:hypothetical protein
VRVWVLWWWLRQGGTRAQPHQGQDGRVVFRLWTCAAGAVSLRLLFSALPDPAARRPFLTAPASCSTNNFLSPCFVSIRDPSIHSILSFIDFALLRGLQTRHIAVASYSRDLLLAAPAASILGGPFSSVGREKEADVSKPLSVALYQNFFLFYFLSSSHLEPSRRPRRKPGSRFVPHCYIWPGVDQNGVPRRPGQRVRWPSDAGHASGRRGKARPGRAKR